MKLTLYYSIFISGALFARGQSTIAWDQQATNFVDGFVNFTNQPMGQPFTPSQSSVDVAALFIGTFPGAFGNVEVNIRSGSITGTIIGTSQSQAITDAGIYDFLFSQPISLNPGTTYYLQPFAVDGDGIGADLINAPGFTGSAIIGGVSHNNFNYWFQEGNVVPEPPSAALFLSGASITYWLRRRSRRTG